jgi:hypothetical protein
VNPTRLLAHFDRISAAPGAILRLRRFILDLAVWGKLTDQNAGDEPATELLTRVRAENVQLKKGTPRRQRGLHVEIENNELPFPAPLGWVWTGLKTLSRKIHYGFTASADHSLKTFASCESLTFKTTQSIGPPCQGARFRTARLFNTSFSETTF